MDVLTDIGDGDGPSGGRIAPGADPVARVIAEGAGAFPADGEPGRLLRRIADALAEPLEVAVSGRRGVGRSGVAALLVDGLGASEPAGDVAGDDAASRDATGRDVAGREVPGRDRSSRGTPSRDGDRGEPTAPPDFRVIDLPPIDVPDHPDPDLDRDILVHVVGEGWYDVDLAAIHGRDPATTVVVIGHTVTDVVAARDRWTRGGRSTPPVYVVSAGAASDAPIPEGWDPAEPNDPAEPCDPAEPNDVAGLIGAVAAGREVALRRRYQRAVDEVDEAAITHRFARDRLEALLQRIAVVRAAPR